MEPGTVGIVVALAVVVVMLILIFIKTNLIICQPNEVLIFSGRTRTLSDGTKVGFRAIRGGRGFRIPFIESVSRMSLNTMRVEISLSKALTAGVIPINVEGIATVKIAGSEAQGLSNAIERFLGRSSHEVATVARETVEGSLRGVLAKLAPEEANAERLDVARQAAEAAGEDLEKLGLVLDTLKIQDLSDEQGYLEAIGRKRNAEVNKDARIAEANAEAQAREVAARARQQGAVAEATAGKKVAEAENELRIVEAQLASKANQAEERAKVAGRIARVEEERHLEEERVELNRKKFEAEVVVPAHAEKEAEELRARGRAAKILEDGKATAEALAQLRSQWASGESRDLMLLQMLPDLLERVTTVLSENLHIERLTVLDSGGGGLPEHVKGLTGSIVTVFEQLKNATGLDIASLLQSKTNGLDASFRKELE